MKFKIQMTNAKTIKEIPIKQDLANYGSGIFMDYTEINFAEREINGNIEVEASFGELSEVSMEGYLRAYVLNLNHGNIRQGILELNINQTTSNASAYLKLVIEENCKVNISEVITVFDYANLTIEVVVGQNAVVSYHALQTIGADKYLTVSRNADVAKDGRINWFDFNLGGKIVKSSISTTLIEQGAESILNGIFLANDKQHFDLYNSSTHKVGRTKSEMTVKGVLDGHAKTIYRGLIKIAPMAVNSQASQRQDTLLLSPTAEIDSVPDLEIGNNEVKCSHAVTTSTINTEKLFYLTSRGLNELQARRVLIESSLMPQVQQIENEALREKVLALITEKIK